MIPYSRGDSLETRERIAMWLWVQVISLILPRRVNLRRKSAWYAKGGEPPDMSPDDAQVSIFKFVDQYLMIAR